MHIQMDRRKYENKLNFGHILIFGRYVVIMKILGA